jgi:hypothetical protein
MQTNLRKVNVKNGKALFQPLHQIQTAESVGVLVVVMTCGGSRPARTSRFENEFKRF